jgi:dynein light intermediate chain 1, cytosolic
LDNNSDADNFDDLMSMLPLPEGVLKSNLGIPIIVACHKVDLLGRGEKQKYLEQNLEFIQKNVRSYCLTYGASMIFTDIH